MHGKASAISGSSIRRRSCWRRSRSGTAYGRRPAGRRTPSRFLSRLSRPSPSPWTRSGPETPGVSRLPRHRCRALCWLPARIAAEGRVMASGTWISFPHSEGETNRRAHVRLPDGRFERELGREGFFGPAAHMYHRNPADSLDRLGRAAPPPRLRPEQTARRGFPLGGPAGAAQRPCRLPLLARGGADGPSGPQRRRRRPALPA